MSRNRTPRWQLPEMTADPKDKVGAAEEIVQDSERWLQTQPAYRDLNHAVQLISGRPEPDADQNRSRLITNRAKRSLREIVASLADTRYLDGFSSDNKAFLSYAEMLNNMVKAIYYESSYDRTMKQAAQWITLGGSAYVWPNWRKVHMGPKAPIAECFDVYGPCDCIPYMLPQNNDNQGAYLHTIIRLMPPPEAHAKFPEFQHKLRAISKRRFRSDVVNTRMTLLDRWREGDRSGQAYCDDYCEIRYQLIRDMRMNLTDLPIPMGPAGASWSYLVPFIGQEIPGREIGGGQRAMRRATEEDCYLYPNMRLLITASGCDVPLYDGPAFSWHGKFPARFSADDWVTEPLGYSLARDIYDLERTRQFTERSIDQVAKARVDPALAYDTNAINPTTAEDFDPFEARKRLGVDGEVTDKTFRPALPETLLNVPSWVMEWLKYLSDQEDYLLGVNSLSNLSKAKMNVGGDAMEKLLEMAGPLVKDISRSMEPPTRDVMDMLKYDILQHFDTTRTMRYVGADGISLIAFDFDPVSLVPSHMPGEDESSPSAITSRMERAKIFAENLRLNITPNSLHGVTQTQQKLLYLQLWRGGFPIAPDTVAKALDLPNFGTIDGSTEIERWQNWKKMELQFAAAMKELGTGLMGPQAAGAGPGGGPKGKGGRPPSGNRPPAAKTKGSAEGPRVAVTES